MPTGPRQSHPMSAPAVPSRNNLPQEQVAMKSPAKASSSNPAQSHPEVATPTTGNAMIVNGKQQVVNALLQFSNSVSLRASTDHERQQAQRLLALKKAEFDRYKPHHKAFPAQEISQTKAVEQAEKQYREWESKCQKAEEVVKRDAEIVANYINLPSRTGADEPFLKEKFNATEKRNVELKNDLDNATKSIHQLENKFTELQGKFEQFQGQHQAHGTKISSEFTQLKEKLAGTSDKAQDLATKQENVQSNLEDVKEFRKKNEDQINGLRVAISSLSNTLRGDISTLEGRFDTLNKSLVEVKSNQITGGPFATSEDLVAAKADLSRLTEDVTKHQLLIRELQIREPKHKESSDLLQLDAAPQDSVDHTLTAIQALNKEVSNLKKKLGEVEAKAGEVEKRNSGEFSGVQAKISTLENRVSEQAWQILKTKTANLSNDISRHRSSILTQGKEIEDLKKFVPVIKALQNPSSTATDPRVTSIDERVVKLEERLAEGGLQQTTNFDPTALEKELRELRAKQELDFDSCKQDIQGLRTLQETRVNQDPAAKEAVNRLEITIQEIGARVAKSINDQTDAQNRQDVTLEGNAKAIMHLNARMNNISSLDLAQHMLGQLDAVYPNLRNADSAFTELKTQLTETKTKTGDIDKRSMATQERYAKLRGEVDSMQQAIEGLQAKESTCSQETKDDLAKLNKTVMDTNHYLKEVLPKSFFDLEVKWEDLDQKCKGFEEKFEEMKNDYVLVNDKVDETLPVVADNLEAGFTEFEKKFNDRFESVEKLLGKRNGHKNGIDANVSSSLRSHSNGASDRRDRTTPLGSARRQEVENGSLKRKPTNGGSFSANGNKHAQKKIRYERTDESDDPSFQPQEPTLDDDASQE